MKIIIILFLHAVVGLKHFTITNQVDHENLKILIESSKRFNDSIIVLKPTESKWINGYKIKYVHEYITDFTDDELILITDAHDVYMMNSHQDITNEFNRLKTLDPKMEILISAEVGLWPPQTKKEDYPGFNKRSVFPYVNSGGIIGYVGSFKRVYNDKYDINMCDQYSWAQWYLKSLKNETFPVIRMDFENNIFLSMFTMRSHDLIITEDTFKHKRTSGYPKMIHFNGDKGGYKDYANRLRNFVNKNI